jgi:hypothetical protein
MVCSNSSSLDPDDSGLPIGVHAGFERNPEYGTLVGQGPRTQKEFYDNLFGDFFDFLQIVEAYRYGLDDDSI